MVAFLLTKEFRDKRTMPKKECQITAVVCYTDHMDHDDLLAHIPLFGGLGSEQLTAIRARPPASRRVQAGSMFFLQGDPAATYYVLVQGRVRVATDAEGNQVTLPTSSVPVSFSA